MSEIKEVSVQLDPIAEKALTGGGKSRRRRTRKARLDDLDEPMAGGAVATASSALSPPVAADAAVGPPTVVLKTGADAAPVSGYDPAVTTPTLVKTSEPVSPLAPAPPEQPPVVRPVLSTTTAVGGGGNNVVIKPKNVQAGSNSGPKILPTKKRISNAPAAQTLKKPRLIVPISSVGGGTDEKAAPAIAQPVAAQGTRGGGPKQTRRFKERKISITMKPSKASRKFRKTVKARVAVMPAAAVKKLLLRKGVLKPKKDGSAPPEEMMRGLLTDYLMLHNSE